MTPYEIPLSAEAQKFSIDLADEVYRLRVMWNKHSQCWCLDIRAENGAEVLMGVPLVTGLDILRQYAHLDIGGSLIVQTDHDAQVIPTFANLGVTGRLYFVTEP